MQREGVISDDDKILTWVLPHTDGSITVCQGKNRVCPSPTELRRLTDAQPDPAKFTITRGGAFDEVSDHVGAASRRPHFNYGCGCLGWVDGGRPGQAERASRMPRPISSLRAGLPGGAVSWQLHLRPPNGFGSVPIASGSALAGAATPTQEPSAIAALTSIFVITWRC